MGRKIFDIIILCSKIGATLVCFFFFAMLVNPEVSDRIIPFIVDASEDYDLSQQGIDLDPIYLSADGSGQLSRSSLYSTRYNYEGDKIYGELVTSDTRVIAMNHFLVDYDSPMAPYAETFVAAADDAGLDWRLVASISGVESAFGLLIPYNSYNAWGWRGGSGGDFSDFESWESGISFVTTRIAVGYGTDTEPFSMESTYCPPCGENPAHAWANGVDRYMEELSDYRRNL